MLIATHPVCLRGEKEFSPKRQTNRECCSYFATLPVYLTRGLLGIHCLVHQSLQFFVIQGTRCIVGHNTIGIDDDRMGQHG